MVRPLAILILLSACSFDAAVVAGLNDDAGQRDSGAMFADASNQLSPDASALDASSTELVPEGLVGYWSFDTLIADQVEDLSFSANHGTVVGAQPIVGAVGAALHFDGIGDYVALGNPAALEFTGPITLCAWVRAEQTDGIRNIVAHGYRADPAGAVFLRVSQDQYQGGSWDGSDHKAAAAVPGNDVSAAAWVHLASTFDGSVWRLFRDGIEIDEGDGAPGAVTVDENWAIGARGTGSERFFIGGIDEVRIYNRALVVDELIILAAQ